MSLFSNFYSQTCCISSPIIFVPLHFLNKNLWSKIKIKIKISSPVLSILKRSEENGGGAREEVMSAGTVAQMRHVSKNPQTRRIGTRAGPSSCFQQKQAAALSRRSGRFEKKKKKKVMATRMSRKRGEVKGKKERKKTREKKKTEGRKEREPK